MKNPKSLPALVYVDVEVSYRWRGSELACAYVCVVEQRNTLHRRIVATEHVSGKPEAIIDRVAAVVGEFTREHVLAQVEPF